MVHVGIKGENEDKCRACVCFVFTFSGSIPPVQRLSTFLHAHTWMHTPLLLFPQCMPRECYTAFFKPNHNHLSLEGRREAFKNTILLIPLLVLPSFEWWLAAQTLQFHCLGSSPDCTAYMMCDLI